MLHAFHRSRPQIAAAMSFISAVNRYRELFRHDLLMSARQHWVEAVRVYNKHLLPVLHIQGFVKETPVGGEEDSEWLRGVSMDSLTRVHDAIFTNIRRSSSKGATGGSSSSHSERGARLSHAAKRASAGGGASARQQHVPNPSSSSAGSTFWGSIFRGGGNGGAEPEGPLGADGPDGSAADEYDYINYKLVDGSVRPSPTLFDEAVKEVEERCAAVADADW